LQKQKRETGDEICGKRLPGNNLPVSASEHYAPSSLSGMISRNCKPKHGNQLLHRPYVWAVHHSGFWQDGRMRISPMDTNRKVVRFREGEIPFSVSLSTVIPE
jgi:hypothetical protein